MADFRRPFRSPPLRKRPPNVLQFEPRRRLRPVNVPASWWKANWAFALLIVAPFLGVGAAWVKHTGAWFALPFSGSVAPTAEHYQVSFGRCDGPVRTTCVVDGDTFWLEGTKYRLADVNTPEISSPECAAEARLGERAASRLVGLLNGGGFSLHSTGRDEDRFGRKLRIVTRGGRSIGDTLVAEGLAERWTGSRRRWC